MNEDPSSLQRILIVENSFRVGVAQIIAGYFRSEDFPNLSTIIVDLSEVAAVMKDFDPDVVVVDVDSLRQFEAINVAIEIRTINSEQVSGWGDLSQR